MGPYMEEWLRNQTLGEGFAEDCRFTLIEDEERQVVIILEKPSKAQEMVNRAKA